jgi:hypothetical protein
MPPTGARINILCQHLSLRSFARKVTPGPENFAETANGGYSRVNAAAFASMASIPATFLV